MLRGNRIIHPGISFLTEPSGAKIKTLFPSVWCDLQSPEGGKTPVLVADSPTSHCKCYRRRPGLVTNTWFYCYKLAADVQTFYQKYQFCQNTIAAADVQIHLQKHQTQQEMFRGLVNTPRFIGCRLYTQIIITVVAKTTTGKVLLKTSTQLEIWSKTSPTMTVRQ